jgi:hypothetical protein
LLRRLHGPRERQPLGLAFEILIERDIADYAAKALRGDSADDQVLRVGLVGPVVNDLQNARIRRGKGETVLPTDSSRFTGKGAAAKATRQNEYPSGE